MCELCVVSVLMSCAEKEMLLIYFPAQISITDSLIFISLCLPRQDDQPRSRKVT